MDRKILIGIMAFVIFIGTGIAQTALNVEQADFTVTEKEPEVRYRGTITFTVDGKGTGECYLDEPNMDIDDDFEQCLEDNFAGKRITDATDWLERPYLMNTVTGKRSFNESRIESKPEPAEL